MFEVFAENSKLNAEITEILLAPIIVGTLFLKYCVILFQ